MTEKSTSTTSELDVSALTGYMLGSVELVELLGIGGAGSVYRGVRHGSREEVAVKVFEPGHFRTSAMRTRIIRELQVVAQIEHEHIADIYGFREDERTELAYFTMEYVDGKDLYQTIKKEGPISEKRALRILRAMLDALYAIHQAGYVHRDLKPDNILIANDGTPKLTDFGLVRNLAEPGLTVEGAVLGTPLYMAPEQFNSGEVDPRADLYGLGCVIYHAVTGHPPFDGDFNALANKHQNVPPVPPSCLARALTPEFEGFVLRLMAKLPELRFPDALTALHALPGPKDRLAETGTVRAAKREWGKTRRLESTTRRQRKDTSRRHPGLRPHLPRRVRLMFAGLCLAVIGLAGTVVALLLDPRNSPEPNPDAGAVTEEAAGANANAAVELPPLPGEASERRESPRSALERLLVRAERVLAEPADAGLTAREWLAEWLEWRAQLMDEPAFDLEATLAEWLERHPQSALATLNHDNTHANHADAVATRLAEIGLGSWLARVQQELAMLANRGRIAELEARLQRAAHEIPRRLRSEAFEPWLAFLDETGRWREALTLSRTLTREAKTASSSQHARHLTQQVQAATEELAGIPRAARIHLFAEAHRELAEVTYNGEPRPVRSRQLAGTLPGYPHLITREVVVERGERLEIAPGARLRFALGARLVVRGELFTHGTAELPVHFQPVRDGDTWPGIHIDGGRAHLVATHLRDGAATLTGNADVQGGGLIAAHDAELMLAECRLEGARLVQSTDADAALVGADTGGAALLALRSEVTLVDTTFARNASTAAGGAVALVRCRNVTVTGCRFEDNRAAGPGGALLLWQSHGTVANCHFAGNRSTAEGGALALIEVSSQARILGNHFEANEATAGAALLLRRSVPRIEENHFADNIVTATAEPGPPWTLEWPSGINRTQRDAYLRRLAEANTHNSEN